MARPNDASAIGNAVKGLREAKEAFQRLPELMRDELNWATEVTLSETVRIAKGHIQSSPSIRTRSLLNAIAWTLNRKSGRGKAGVAAVTTTISNPTMGGIGKSTVKVKGILIPGKGGGAKGGRLIKPSRYAHLVEKGTRRMKAEPFMVPAVESQEQPYLDRCLHAGKNVERDLANIGLRNL
jgi:hypothetical protein